MLKSLGSVIVVCAVALGPVAARAAGEENIGAKVFSSGEVGRSIADHAIAPGRAKASFVRKLGLHGLTDWPDSL